MKFAVVAEECERKTSDMNYANELELSEKMDIIEISDESDDSASKNNDIATIAEEIEDSATSRDISKVTEAHAIDKDVLYRTEKADDDPIKWVLGDAGKEIEDLTRSMDIDNAGEVGELASEIDLTEIAEETESSEEEQDVTKGFDSGLSDKELCNFIRDTSKTFFDEWGLVSHQINSFNDLMSCGLQKVFDSVGELEVEPDPLKSRQGEILYRASISFGKVTVEKPSYVTKEGKLLPLKPAEARLRNMTYSSPIYVELTTKVNCQNGTKAHDKSMSSSSLLMKNAKHMQLISEEKKKVQVGRIPIMVKSHLCYLSSLNSKGLLKEADCLFDVGGYFIIKGHEKFVILKAFFSYMGCSWTIVML